MAARCAAGLLLVVGGLWLAPGCVSAQELAGDRPLTVIVVRHAERADGGSNTSPAGRDPELSEAGHARAHRLARVLENAGVGAIITTQYVRTRQTAEPLASRFGLAMRAVDAASGGTEAHVAEVRAAILEIGSGTILVVGHSNTVPALVRLLSGREVPDMADEEFDTFYIVQLGDDPPRVIRAHF